MIRKQILPEYDPQMSGVQYLEDLATGYWYSEALFAAVEMDIFSLVDQRGSTVRELSAITGSSASGLTRLLDALVRLGLLARHGNRYFNTKISGDHLVRGRDGYQGESILWRRELQHNWQSLAECVKTGRRLNYISEDNSGDLDRRRDRYIRAMDSVAKSKAAEILDFFGKVRLKGRLLDAGTGSGAIAAAFLKQHPDISATLMDLPDVLKHTKRFMKGLGSDRKVSYRSANILDPWPFRKGWFDIVVLSNILHAYSEKELPHILGMAAAAVKKNGIIMMHDFFFEHSPVKAALSDLNMLINTYNGRVFSSRAVIKELKKSGLASTGLLPLRSDTAVIFASRNEKRLGNLCVDPIDRLIQIMKETGFRRVYAVRTEDIAISDWPEIRCRFGCSRYGRAHCPPNSIPSEKTGSIVNGYRRAILLEGEPPTRDFQLRMLKAEREAFLAGFHKAFSFWAGPCSICADCSADTVCRNTAKARPSMEGSGIDVFETARRAGASIRTLKGRDEYVKYFGLLLMD